MSQWRLALFLAAVHFFSEGLLIALNFKDQVFVISYPVQPKCRSM